MKRIFTAFVVFWLCSISAIAQTITAVSIPAGNYKIGDPITINFTSATVTGTALVAGSTVNGVALTGFLNLTLGNYSAIYTVVSGNTDRASVGVIPINIGLTAVTDGPFFTGAATSGGTVTIDANAPTISIGAPSAANANNASSVTYTITYAGADAVTLANGNITLH